MNEIREHIEESMLDIEIIKHLSMLLEDYFYNYRGDIEYHKNQSLSIVMTEKTKELESNMRTLIEQIFTIEKENR